METKRKEILILKGNKYLYINIKLYILTNILLLLLIKIKENTTLKFILVLFLLLLILLLIYLKKIDLSLFLIDNYKILYKRDERGKLEDISILINREELSFKEGIEFVYIKEIGKRIYLKKHTGGIINIDLEKVVNRSRFELIIYYLTIKTNKPILIELNGLSEIIY